MSTKKTSIIYISIIYIKKNIYDLVKFNRSHNRLSYNDSYNECGKWFSYKTHLKIQNYYENRLTQQYYLLNATDYGKFIKYYAIKNSMIDICGMNGFHVSYYDDSLLYRMTYCINNVNDGYDISYNKDGTVNTLKYYIDGENIIHPSIIN